nr:MAG TPA: hypothetical protein [Caudoviricetes sp.]
MVIPKTRAIEDAETIVSSVIFCNLTSFSNDNSYFTILLYILLLFSSFFFRFLQFTILYHKCKPLMCESIENF